MAVIPPGSPSVLLQRAAELIEEYAAGATPGPWFYNGRITFQHGGHMLETEDRSTPVAERSVPFGDVDKQGDACWIATLNPAVAAPLVAWLRKSAAHYDTLLDMAEGEVSWMEEWHTSPVSEFARLVLGESP